MLCATHSIHPFSPAAASCGSITVREDDPFSREHYLGARASRPRPATEAAAMRCAQGRLRGLPPPHHTYMRAGWGAHAGGRGRLSLPSALAAGQVASETPTLVRSCVKQCLSRRRRTLATEAATEAAAMRCIQGRLRGLPAPHHTYMRAGWGAHAGGRGRLALPSALAAGQVASETAAPGICQGSGELGAKPV